MEIAVAGDAAFTEVLSTIVVVSMRLLCTLLNNRRIEPCAI
jgi:hypothetical protein